VERNDAKPRRLKRKKCHEDAKTQREKKSVDLKELIEDWKTVNLYVLFVY
jgi:hypothetical protein